MGQEFEFDMRVMEIGAYDMLLGGDWLRKVGPVLIDVEASTVTMIKGGKRLELGGMKEQGVVKVKVREELNKEFGSGELCIVIARIRLDFMLLTHSLNTMSLRD